MVRNKGRNLDNDKARSDLLIDNDCSDDLKTKLSKLSEEGNFEKKNWWMHKKKTMQYADKKKMPIEKSKVVDMLRHSNVFKGKIVGEIETYFKFQNNPMF